jgi:hypothetical protein
MEGGENNSNCIFHGPGGKSGGRGNGRQIRRPRPPAGRNKNPDRPNPFVVVLVVVVLVAIVEVLVPRVVAIVLGGTPIVVRRETSNIFPQERGDAPERPLWPYDCTGPGSALLPPYGTGPLAAFIPSLARSRRP